MGKTERGTVWLDAARTSPYELYQYWMNMSDADVGRFLRLFTFLPLEAIEELEAKNDPPLARETLAYENTTLVHGEAAAEQAREASRNAFGGAVEAAELPSVEVTLAQFADGMTAAELFVASGLSSSKGEARRLIRQGGAYLNESRVEDPERTIGDDAFRDGTAVLRRGRKQYRRIALV
jgi:tyrosyl-tRNA synthetase